MANTIKLDNGKVITLAPKGSFVKDGVTGNSDKSLIFDKSKTLKTTANATVFPITFTIPEYSALQPKNQNPYNSCTAHSASYLFEIAHYKLFESIMKFSTDFLYGNRGVYDLMKIPDTKDDGMTPEQIGSRMVAFGDTPWDVLPGTHSTMDAKLSLKVLAGYYKSVASSYRYFKRATQVITVDELKQALIDGKCCCVYIKVYTGGMNNNQFNSKGSYIGDHAVCVIGWDELGINLFNSWSTDKADCNWYIPYEDFDAILTFCWAFDVDSPQGYVDTDAILEMPHEVRFSIRDVSGNETDSRYLLASNRHEALQAIKESPMTLDSNDIVFIESLAVEKYEDNSYDVISPVTKQMKKTFKYVNTGSDEMSFGAKFFSELLQNPFNPIYDGLILAKQGDNIDGIPAQCMVGAKITEGRKYQPFFLTDNNTPSNEAIYFAQNDDTDKYKNIIGSNALISDDIVNKILGGMKTRRIYGANRYSSATAIADYVVTNPTDIIIVNQADWTDALCASALTVRNNTPVLYVDGTATLNQEVIDYINAHPSISSATIFGGPALVPDAIITKLFNLGLVVGRYYGSDRYESSGIIADNLGGNYHTVTLAVGTDFSKCSSAAAIASIVGGPLILCDGLSLNAKVASIINSYKAKYNSPILLGSVASAFSTTLLNSLNS
ncbi:hypothetical protein vBCtySFA88_00027 [Clostridium phage vB_CtyS-FA88]|nr:hypothetical protein vBCtySFA88_00027 [Clostridium phage vB_CtyS-FA88]